MKKQATLVLALAFGCVMAVAQGISPQLLKQLQDANKLTAQDRMVRNALASGSVNSLIANQDHMDEQEVYFNYSVPNKGITNQRSSGRCWLFSGLNVLRSKVINEQGLEGLEFSQVYGFFYDQLEKANLFLQGIIDTSDKPIDDQTVRFLFKAPVSDGGTFCGVIDIVGKYGVVPAGVLHETYSSNNTSQFNVYVKRKLREMGIQLREKAAAGASKKELIKAKEEMLSTVYHMLTLGYGVPPTEFMWAPKDSKGKYTSEPKKYTPQSFYKEWIGEDLAGDYIMLMNDPTREYWKTYEIEYDRHSYDGHNWYYLNLPMDEIKACAIASIKDNRMFYMSCDVNKELDRSRGFLDLNNYDSEALFGTPFGMDKRQRILTLDSGSTHAMTMKAVHVDEATGKPVRWEVENSWGSTSGYKGHLIMSDKWLDEYLFRIVVKKQYCSDKILKAYKQKPTMLPAWDPMFQMDE